MLDDDDLCRADIDRDLVVGVSDLLAVLPAWGPCAELVCAADVTEDGSVDVADLLLILSRWGEC